MTFLLIALFHCPTFIYEWSFLILFRILRELDYETWVKVVLCHWALLFLKTLLCWLELIFLLLETSFESFYMWFKSCVVTAFFLFPKNKAHIPPWPAGTLDDSLFPLWWSQPPATLLHTTVRETSGPHTLFSLISTGGREGPKACTLVKQIINSELHSGAEPHNWNSLTEAQFTGDQCSTAVEHFHFLLAHGLVLRIHEWPNRIRCPGGTFMRQSYFCWRQIWEDVWNNVAVPSWQHCLTHKHGGRTAQVDGIARRRCHLKESADGRVGAGESRCRQRGAAVCRTTALAALRSFFSMTLRMRLNVIGGSYCSDGKNQSREGRAATRMPDWTASR